MTILRFRLPYAMSMAEARRIARALVAQRYSYIAVALFEDHTDVSMGKVGQ